MVVRVSAEEVEAETEGIGVMGIDGVRMDATIVGKEESDRGEEEEREGGRDEEAVSEEGPDGRGGRVASGGGAGCAAWHGS